MNSFFAKIIFSLASILGLIGSPSYVQLGADSLIYNFKTGDNSPIVYYLTVKNIGPQKARFDVSSNKPWLFVYREGQPGAISVEIFQNAAVNFVLEIHAEQPGDGSNTAEISVNAVDHSSYAVIDSKKVAVTLNKNIKIETVTAAPSVLPSVTLTAGSPVATLTVTPTAIPIITTRSTPTSSARQTPARTIRPSPSLDSSKLELGKPMPIPTPSVSARPQSQTRTTPLKSFWQFFRDLLF